MLVVVVCSQSHYPSLTKGLAKLKIKSREHFNTKVGAGVVAQLVLRVRSFQLHRRARDFSLRRVNFQCRLSYDIRTAPCAPRSGKLRTQKLKSYLVRTQYRA